MKELILIKSGEIALKGLNKNSFEERMKKNILSAVKDLGPFSIKSAQSTMYLMPEGACDMDEAAERVGKVFGISAYTRAAECEKDFESIKATAAEYLHDQLMDVKTFKVNAKRADKKFPMTSPELCVELGGLLLEQFPHLSVDVHEPELNVVVEVRDFGAYLHGKSLRGAGGIPVGSSGKAMLLISGGIDSPVAGYMMAKRGVSLSAVHFMSPPYTSERAFLKVQSLARQMTDYTGPIKLYSVQFTEIQEAIRDRCEEEYFTLIMRRFMMRIAQRLARRSENLALITGESLGQVASQTMPALVCTDAVCRMPVLRPLIGMDKEEIVRISRAIGTFETSTLPYEDCCTVFTPKHPRTRPSPAAVEKEEAKLPVDELIEKALSTVESRLITH